MADPSTPDHDTELDHQRLAAMRMLLRVGQVGTVISASLAEGIKSEELVKNDNVAVMADLWVAESRRPAEIQLLTGLTSGGVTKLLDRMEELGVIQRSFGKVPGDRRAIVVTLTPHGEEIVCSMADGILDHLGALRSALATVIALIDEAEGAIAATGTGA
ncbi:MAG TPA: hypothetical protein VES19_06775 [Candidatus Limnocylindrales bacterium]|nr:hypothetical protein [Candidatus Limnocylindrales bacterium]